LLTMPVLVEIIGAIEFAIVAITGAIAAAGG
jgi:hypothetical protein